MAAIISQSTASWQAKVKLAFLAFDFDESKALTKDEMVIMILSFIRGIGLINNTQISKSIDLEGLAKHCFEIADKNPDGVVTLEELTFWVANTSTVHRLFSKTEKKIVKSKKIIQTAKVLNKKNEKGKVLLKRRQSISVSFTGRKIVKSANQPRRSNLNDEVNVGELQILFKKIENSLGTANLGNVFYAMGENQRFSEDSDYLFHEFGFDRNKEINFEQLLNYLRKRRARSGYVFERGGIRFTDLGSRKSESTRRNTKVFQNMFKSFDQTNDGKMKLDEISNRLMQKFSSEDIKDMFSSCK
jgi:Ca2+-binding EF-hand superfamily protein